MGNKDRGNMFQVKGFFTGNPFHFCSKVICGIGIFGMGNGVSPYLVFAKQTLYIMD